MTTIERDETSELVRRGRQGDVAAQEQLYRKFAPAAYRLALAMTHGRVADAEDLLQDAFVQCLGRLTDLREPARFGGWLLKTVRNMGINQYQASRARKRALERASRMSDPERAARHADPFAELAAQQRARVVRAVFETLPEGPLKETAQLYYLDGVEQTRDVARRMDVPKSTVTTRLDRFRRLVRKQLVAQLAEPRDPTSPDPSSDEAP